MNGQSNLILTKFKNFKSAFCYQLVNSRLTTCYKLYTCSTSCSADGVNICVKILPPLSSSLKDKVGQHRDHRNLNKKLTCNLLNFQTKTNNDPPSDRKQHFYGKKCIFSRKTIATATRLYYN